MREIGVCVITGWLLCLGWCIMVEMRESPAPVRDPIDNNMSAWFVNEEAGGIYVQCFTDCDVLNSKGDIMGTVKNGNLYLRSGFSRHDVEDRLREAAKKFNAFKKFSWAEARLDEPKKERI